VKTDTIDTRDKLSELLDILLTNPPNDKKFNNNHFNYILKLFSISEHIEQEEYSEDLIEKEINALYNKVFKNRRY